MKRVVSEINLGSINLVTIESLKEENAKLKNEIIKLVPFLEEVQDYGGETNELRERAGGHLYEVKYILKRGGK